MSGRPALDKKTKAGSEYNSWNPKQAVLYKLRNDYALNAFDDYINRPCSTSVVGERRFFSTGKRRPRYINRPCQLNELANEMQIH